MHAVYQLYHDVSWATWASLNGFRHYIVNPPIEEDGQGLVEYALILVLVAIVVIASLATMGSVLNEQMYEGIVEAIEERMP